MIRVLIATLSITALMLAVLMLTSCGGTPVLPGDLGKMTGGVLVPCEPIPGQKRSCLVLANPNNENLKIFDATTRQFLLAPRGYSSLSVPVGRRTQRLASAPNIASAPALDFVLALDTVSNQVYRVRTRGDTAATPTFAVAATFAAPTESPAAGSAPGTLPGKASDIILARVGGGSEYSVVYALPKSLYISPINNATLLPTASSGFSIGFSRNIACIAINQDSGDQDSSYLAVAFENDASAGADAKSVMVAKLSAINNGLKEGGFTEINIGGFASQLQIRALSFDSEPKAIPFVFALNNDAPLTGTAPTYELIATRIDKPATKPVKTTFKHLLTAMYLPPPNPRPCCGGSKRWAAVMTVQGTFHYITVGDLDPTTNNPKALTDAEHQNLSDEASLGSQAIFPTAIFGGPVITPPGTPADDQGVNCPNRIFITFQSGLLATGCEGQKGFSKVGL